MSQPIVFYDIPSNAKGIAWSPSTWKTRYCLNIKGIPYTTVWVEYPDIEPLCKKIGANATSKKADGSPHYTLPVIYNPNTKEVVADSAAIARYLDKTYPETKRLIPEEADALIAAFGDAVRGLYPTHDYAPLSYSAMAPRMREKSQQYFREAREKYFGAKLEDLAPAGSEKRAGHWANVKKGLQRVATNWLEADGKEKLLFMGEKAGITYADIIIAAWFTSMRASFGDEDAEWKEMMTWNGGRWARFLDAFGEYSNVDEGADVQL